MVVSGAGAYEDGPPQSIHVMRHPREVVLPLYEPFLHHLGDEENHSAADKRSKLIVDYKALSASPVK